MLYMLCKVKTDCFCFLNVETFHDVSRFLLNLVSTFSCYLTDNRACLIGSRLLCSFFISRRFLLHADGSDSKAARTTHRLISDNIIASMAECQQHVQRCVKSHSSGVFVLAFKCEVRMPRSASRPIRPSASLRFVPWIIQRIHGHTVFFVSLKCHRQG